MLLIEKTIRLAQYDYETELLRMRARGLCEASKELVRFGNELLLLFQQGA